MKNLDIEKNLTCKIYVSPGCEERGDGSREHPFSSAKDAPAAMRKAVKNGLDGDAGILFFGGTYYLREPIIIGNEDYDENHRIYYAPADGENVKIVGGVPVTGWSDCGGGIFRADISSVGDFYALYRDGKRLPVARSYNISGKGIKDASRLQAVYENSSAWFGEILKIKRFTENGFETDIEKCDWSGPVTCIQGAREFIEKPGDWAIEGNYVYFMPENPEKVNESVTVAGISDEIFTVRGKKDEPVKNIEICGFELTMNAFGENLAAQARPKNVTAEFNGNLNALVSFQNAENAAVTRCRMSLAGYTAVTLKGHCQFNTVYGNDIVSPGYAGVFLMGENPGSLNYCNRKNTVENNRMRDLGVYVTHGAGIYLINSGENLITRNDISGAPRYGISLKGIRYGVFHDNRIDGVPFEDHWKYNQTTKNVISYNVISNTGIRSADGGGIEGWGIGRDNVIDHNIVRNAYCGKASDGWRGHSIFLDDATHYVTVTNNIVYDDAAPAVNAGIFIKSIENCVVNNIFDVSLEKNGAADIKPYICPAGDSVFEHNIVYASCDGSILPDGSLSDGDGDRIMLSFGDDGNGVRALDSLKRMGKNLYFNKKGMALIDTGKGVVTFEEWQKSPENRHGYDSDSLCADPLFIDAENRDYRLREDSPALKLGIKPIDVSQTGLKDDFIF